MKVMEVVLVAIRCETGAKLLPMKAWIILFVVASLLIVACNAELFRENNRKLLSNKLNRVVPGGPNRVFPPRSFGERKFRAPPPPRV
ncbi:hypothetical protein PHJA_001038200 [Phtheirospermum japonicum]|uniref:Uncharacterized protein n=1 Tax=Phtheirospermum japonicum TaxID=374723 RepID=A0A830C0E9_9LAMI|nr:hypothetical protein PHJA_001038200 [Phtheirospermum japonicum]